MTRTTRLTLALLATILLGCDRLELPVAPAAPTLPASFLDGSSMDSGDALPAPTVSPLHILHTDFVSVEPNDRFVGSTLIKGTPIAFAADYFYAAGSFGQADGIVTVTLPTGGTVTAVRAYLYGDGSGSPAGTVRIADVGLWRIGEAACPVLGDTRAYCPYGWVSLVTGADPNGWSTKTLAVSQPILAGFTYKVIVNLRNTTVVDQKLRLGWVEIEYADPPPAPPFTATVAAQARPMLLTTADRAQLDRASAYLRTAGLDH